MGIQGLLPLLKSIQKPCNLKKFEGKTLGVDAYGWLHRGTVACAMDLAMGVPTKKFVDFCMHRVRMLQHFGVTPYLIFDGDYLPIKAGTEKDRNKRREDARRAGKDLLNAGKQQLAYQEFQKAVDVSPQMARQFIDELKAAGVQYIVAPYEADAQMVYLERIGVIDGILSEDSDLLVFGAKCLLTKLDQYGDCIEVNKSDFCICKEISLTGWSDADFRRMAILSGCDYLASINNMGLKTAYRMVRKHKTIEQIIRMLQFDGKHHVPKGYLEAFHQAELTFLHQWVFCPKLQTLVYHTQPDSMIAEDQMPFIGKYIEPEVAQGVALGDLDPMTKLPIVVSKLRNRMVTSTSPWTTPRPQPRRSATSDDMKKNTTPINAYFKRTPLQELPTNIQTYSPSQLEILRRASSEWEADPVAPRFRLDRSATVSEPAPQVSQSAPVRPPQSSGSDRAVTTRISEPRPQKRARLCNVDPILSPVSGKKLDLVSSHFFSSDPDPSPTASRFSRTKRAKKDDFHIFSDDSIEDAMRELSEFNGFKEPKPEKIEIMKDTQEEDDCSSTDQSVTSSWSQSSLPSLTSTTSSAAQPETPQSQEYSTPCGLGLKERFAFTAGPSTPNYQRDPPKSTALSSSMLQRASKIPLAVKPNILASQRAMLSSKPTMMTPLQRLGARVGNRSQLPMTPPMTPVLTNKIGGSFLLNAPFPEAQGRSKLQQIEPASIPLPAPDEAENLALSLQAGSEDLIIHDSDSDEDELSINHEETSITNTNLNFQRFAFAG